MNRIGEKIDFKNIGLVKILFNLRQDLDIYTLVALNADKLNRRGQGRSFWGRIQDLSICSIVLAITKIYEEEKRYELNSVPGLMRMLEVENFVPLENRRSNEFFKEYGRFAPSSDPSPNVYLRKVVNEFIASKDRDLVLLKDSRDKTITHGEFGASSHALPSFDTIEGLYRFAKDVYSVVCDDYVGVGPADLDSSRTLIVGLESILEELCGERIDTEWKK